MSQLFIIIQARMTSNRLPGKVLLPLCDRTVLEVMLRRLQKLSSHIVVATTDDGSENPIVELCHRNHVRYYRGNVHDVLSRYYYTAVQYGATQGDVIVRCTSDCPLIDVTVLSQAIEMFERSQQKSIVTTGQPTGYPRGLDVEIFLYDQLYEAFHEAQTPFEREHVTPYIKHHSQWIKHTSFKDYSHFRLTLDVPEDYEVIQKTYALFKNSFDFSYRELVNQLERHPEITAINKEIAQKPG